MPPVAGMSIDGRTDEAGELMVGEDIRGEEKGFDILGSVEDVRRASHWPLDMGFLHACTLAVW